MLYSSLLTYNWTKNENKIISYGTRDSSGVQMFLSLFPLLPYLVIWCCLHFASFWIWIWIWFCYCRIEIHFGCGFVTAFNYLVLIHSTQCVACNVCLLLAHISITLYLVKHFNVACCLLPLDCVAQLTQFNFICVSLFPLSNVVCRYTVM